MNTSQVSKYAVMKTVSAELLEQATEEGWRLVETITTDAMQTVYEHDMTVEVKLDNYGNSNKRPEVKRSVLIKTVLFLVGKDEDSALRVLKEKYDAVLHDLDIQRTERHNAILKAQAASKEAEELKSRCDKLKDSLLGAENGSYSKGERLRTMESDMAKIRIAVGDLKVKEILGAKS